MPSLILSSGTVRVNLLSERLEVVRKSEDGSRDEAVQVPLFDIDRMVVVGRPAVSMPVFIELMKRGIPCFFVSSHGRWRGTLTPDNNLNADRRIRQYEQGTDPAFTIRVARKLVYAKIRNSRRVLQRLVDNRGFTDRQEYQTVMQTLQAYARDSLQAESADILRGIEGIAAAVYFSRLGDFFPKSIPFAKRTRRPPRDPANALLSFGYTILLSEMECAIRKHGLDAGIGVLHTDRVNTPSLALDLMEPLRAPIVDLLVLNIVNHLMVKPEGHFDVQPDDGGVYLNENGRKSFFMAYEQAMCRRFSLEKDMPHTDFRQIIENQSVEFLSALEKNDDPEFFFLP